ncbi:MAG: polymer-forming cytoskeletal protein [candidate division Zixibacteria bacterium]|nr:polymer-forming cytoskeletal protein [candidate division Zixibacteria bacterium]
MSNKDLKSEGKLDTIIGKGTKIEGTITIDGSTRIDGFISGKLISNDVVTIGPNGEVKAEVKAKSIILGGRVEGNLEASEKVELQAKSELRGDLIAKSLLIEHGALFHGSSNMINKSVNQIAHPDKKQEIQKK